MCFWIKLLYENILTNRGAEEVSITGLQLRRSCSVLWWLSSLPCSSVTPLSPPLHSAAKVARGESPLTLISQTHGFGLLPELKGICGLRKHFCPYRVKVSHRWWSCCSFGTEGTLVVLSAPCWGWPSVNNHLSRWLSGGFQGSSEWQLCLLIHAAFFFFFFRVK